MTIRHFAGGNNESLVAALEGTDVLVTYYDVVTRPGIWKRELLPRLKARKFGRTILDSGAFTELSQKKRGVPNPFHVDVHEYARFAKAHEDLFDVIVNLDDIGGDLERSRRNQKVLEAAGVDAIPVFHGREPWKVLEGYARRYGRVGLGFYREPAGSRIVVSSDQGDGLTPRQWIAEAFRRIGGRAKVHGFAMSRYADEFPFESVDSTTWIAEKCGLCRRDGSSHSANGELGEILDGLDLDGVLRLVVRSYSAKGGFVNGVFPRELARGQAKTVLSRFSDDELEAELGALAA